MCILVQIVGFLKYKSVILQGYKMKNILGLFDFARRFAIRFIFWFRKSNAKIN